MSSAIGFRSALTALALIGTAVLAGCAEPKPEAPAPLPPALALAPSLIEQASAYRYYVTRSSAISPSFDDGAEIAESLKTSAAYEPIQLLKGAVAYGAVAALQDPEFVAAVRSYSTNPETRNKMFADLVADPTYAATLPGAKSAAGLVIAAYGAEGKRLFETGSAVKQAAYDVQKARWSRAEVENRALRLSQAKALSATPIVGELEETARLQQAAIGAGVLDLTAAPVEPPYSRMVLRSLAVAALAVLGEAGENRAELLTAVMIEPTSASCLNMAKLNLYQCLAVSKPHYEDVFCLGQHALMDTGQCLMKGAGLVDPAKVTPVQVAQTGASAETAAFSAVKSR
ncbi:MAG: hypothetical protein Q7V15_15105 [Phenylobacterium sp.]|uniref:hypothetical protein n=1 Tax=Phenylobacterium sp. TaxID=1871053 RepID=UPI00272475D2|nr:hypothetical protein [Phenylobacterium sp.]MDO8902673.1 hypothetical protein [Phenylobacterium sp.]MDP2214411.1 hypothetical protein [Phenylobacterium sp.]